MRPNEPYMPVPSDYLEKTSIKFHLARAIEYVDKAFHNPLENDRQILPISFSNK